MFDSGLKAGEKINNRRLMDIFHCACEGGIRYASITQTIIIVVNNTKTGLPDKWLDGVLEFAGRPLKKGGQFTGANRRLEQFLNSHGDIFLFAVNQPGIYEFLGPVTSAGTPRIEKTADNISYPVFPLRLERAQSAESPE